MTIGQLHRQFEALKRKYARVIAAAILRPAANQTAQLWAIAVAKKQPKPNPLSCVYKVVDAGFPGAQEIIQRLLPPRKPVVLSAVLPGIF